jgi:hypothetical protein
MQNLICPLICMCHLWHYPFSNGFDSVFWGLDQKLSDGINFGIFHSNIILTLHEAEAVKEIYYCTYL